MRRMAVPVALAFLGVACGSQEVSHRPFPQVRTLDGAVLAPLRLITIVPGNDSADLSAFVAFSEAVGGSSWWRAIAHEYHLGSAVSAAGVIGPAITADVTDHDVFTYITGVVSGEPSLDRDGHTLYLLYLPPDVHVVRDGTPNTGCTLFGAYHARYGILGDNLAVVQRCFTDNPVENMTVAASHEIAEAATDPDGHGYRLPAVATSKPWTESIWNAFDLIGGAEVGDLCEGAYWVDNSGGAPEVYQRIWSNHAAAGGGDPCVPALGEPYYSTAIEQDWYPVQPGATISIPVTGWATGDIASWPLVVRAQGTVDGFTATLASPQLGPAQVDEIQASAPATAVSGDYAVLSVVSQRPPPSFDGRQLTDGAHRNLVGVYVP
jgi:hypothetical protein